VRSVSVPPELLKPSPTQIDLVLDEATRVVDELDDRACHLGSKFGIPMHQWALKERNYGVNSQSQGWEIAVAVLAAPHLWSAHHSCLVEKGLGDRAGSTVSACGSW
jgi:hypothetical protein